MQVQNLDLALLKKWCSERGNRFTTTAPKHQESNDLVESHWGTFVKMVNILYYYMPDLARNSSTMQQSMHKEFIM